jgi:hypothetical protein
MVTLQGAAIAVVIGVGFAAFATGPCAQASGLAAQVDADNQWKQFRQTVGAHSQVIAVSKPYADGSRLIILAEPSPTLDDDAIERDTSGVDTAAFTGKKRIGVDGWVQDTLLVVPKVTNSRLADTLARLSLDAYGTTYQSIPVALPLEKSTSPNAPLDLSIDASELHDLLLRDPQQTFYSIVSPTPEHSIGYSAARTSAITSAENRVSPSSCCPAVPRSTSSDPISLGSHGSRT